MIDRWLVCGWCSARFPLGPLFEGCPSCELTPLRAALEVGLDLSAAGRALDPAALRASGGSLWRFAPLLPLRDPAGAVSLGEGGTPLVHLARLNEAVGTERLLVKNESLNPTWSFKDRFNAVSIGVARELGFEKIVCSSTGNHGVSAAAYAAAAGLRCLVLVPHETPMLQRRLIEAYGARAIATTWDGRGELMAELVRHHGWFPSKGSLPAPIGNPFGLEGYKTIGYELAIQSLDAPLDYVLCSVGGGDQLYGIFKGMRELRELGVLSALPRFVACQAEQASPVVDALEGGAARVAPLAEAYSMATSTREAAAGDHTLRAVRESDGLGVRVPEAEILWGMRTLAQSGLAAEAASSIPVAAARRLVQEDRVPASARIACVLTASGIKWPEQLALLGDQPASIEPSVEQLRTVVEF